MRFVLEEELEGYIKLGWENTNRKKGMKIQLSKEGKEKLTAARRKDQTGKVGLQAKAAKGPYTIEFKDGRTYTAGSYPELTKATGLKMSTLHYRHKKGNTEFLKEWRIY